MSSLTNRTKTTEHRFPARNIGIETRLIALSENNPCIIYDVDNL